MNSHDVWLALLFLLTAVILNAVVATIGIWNFWRGGWFIWRLFWLFAVTSTPAALIGGGITLPHIY